MAVGLEPIKKVKCTYKDCPASFDTESQMRAHKKNSPEHDYCSRCKEDFDSHEDLLYHKIKRPDRHNKACRICGDEFRSDAGLKLHIQKCHSVDQKLGCICGENFYRASHIVEHWEFGHCDDVSASEFVGRIVHKHLVSELLKDGPNRVRFEAKIATFEGAVDQETGGGVTLMDEQLQDTEVNALDYAAIEPEIIETPSHDAHAVDPYPPLPSQAKKAEDSKSVVSDKKVEDVESVLSTNLTELSLDDHFRAVATGQLPFSPRPTATGQLPLSPPSTATGGILLSPESEATNQNPFFLNSNATGLLPFTPKSNNSNGSEQEKLKAASKRKDAIIDTASVSSEKAVAAWTKNTAEALFPHAQPTPPPSKWSVQRHDKTMDKQAGLNIMHIRFWDPASKDWLPERFYSTVLSVYQCPFPCAQKFDTPGDLSRHILDDHRVTSMRCPRCLDSFRSCTALVAHCESGSHKCNIRTADDFGIFLSRLTGGFLGVWEQIRPDHLHNPPVMLTDPTTKRLKVYKPPVVRYLKYQVTMPADLEGKNEKVAARWGGAPRENRGLLK